MGEGHGDVLMMEFLKMGGYAGYVWSSYGIVAVVLAINIFNSFKRHQNLLRRLKQLHTTEDKNES